MKLDKVYNEVVKEVLKSNRRVIMGCIDNDTIGITTNGFMMYFIPKNEFLLDADALIKNRVNNANLDLFKEPKDLKEVVKTNVYCKQGKNTLVKIGDKYFNEKYLKNFEEYASFKTTDKFNAPLYVYEDDVLVGLVMPVRVDDKVN